MKIIGLIYQELKHCVDDFENKFLLPRLAVFFYFLGDSIQEYLVLQGEQFDEETDENQCESCSKENCECRRETITVFDSGGFSSLKVVN